MNENLEYELMAVACTNTDDVDSAIFEVYGSDENDVESSWDVDVTRLCGQALQEIKDLSTAWEAAKLIKNQLKEEYAALQQENERLNLEVDRLIQVRNDFAEINEKNVNELNVARNTSRILTACIQAIDPDRLKGSETLGRIADNYNQEIAARAVEAFAEYIDDGWEGCAKSYCGKIRSGEIEV